MLKLNGMFSAFVAAGLVPTILAVPTPMPQMSFTPNLGNDGPIGGVKVGPAPTTTATGFSGALYGDESLLGEVAAPSPVSGGNSAQVTNYELVNGQEADSTLGLYLNFNSVENPQPLRGSGGQTDPGPREHLFFGRSHNLTFLGTYEYDKINPDVLAPPGSDAGDVPQAMWPMGLSHNRFGTGKASGWARQQNEDVLPSATKFAGVDMRLAPHAYRELHWHTANEWSLILKGCVRLSAINENGQTFLDDVCAGRCSFLCSYDVF